MAQVDGVLMDLGISSPQIDEAERGFSFRFDAPLDMRMDTTRGLTAAQWLAEADEADIREVIKPMAKSGLLNRLQRRLWRLGPNPRSRARASSPAWSRKNVRTREPGQDPATRTFQAIRIYLNRELEELSATLPQIIGRLAQRPPGGDQLSFAGRPHR